ncbi:DUF1254 domain-containing protein [Pseudomonas akapageensis]|uniref:DUF1254 domain-containing protein n=1 Tax=Pseudomonas akapageensis TaxID=2609961 RepID=UPI00140D7812|nr:DUF1254 domain-containing protein [Pseudomonas akapageensis]
MKNRIVQLAQTTLLAAMACSALLSAPAGAAQLTPDEARSIARDAYIYGFPLVDNYRIQHAYFEDRSHPEYKAPWNQLHSDARVYTPDDKAIQTPNSDTPYSQLGADLRSEPLVLSMPAVEAGRYYTAQFIDAYTHNFAYAGSRTTGNEAGNFLLVGPGWKGETPAGIKQVFRSETDFVYVFYRTQLFNPADIDNVRKVQAGFKVQPLSAWLGKPAPVAAPRIDFPEPLSVEQERNSLQFFNILNFVLSYCPTHPSEQALMERFARLDIGAGQRFDAQTLSPELRKAVEQGMADAWQANRELDKLAASGALTSGDLLGSREYLKNNYLYRMRAADSGIYGNSREEAIYPSYMVDADGQRLDGGNRYVLRFAPGQLPPVNAFWSLTLYELPSRLLVANPLKRYLINAPMLPDLKRDADGGLTLYIQHDSPGKDKETNWLPAPKGSFLLAMRLFWPKPEALDGAWKKPPLLREQQVLASH